MSASVTSKQGCDVQLYEADGLNNAQARQIADELCGSALWHEGHAWVSETCVVRPRGCRCQQCQPQRSLLNPHSSVESSSPSGDSTALIADKLGQAHNELFLQLETPSAHHAKAMWAAADELKAVGKQTERLRTTLFDAQAALLREGIRSGAIERDRDEWKSLAADRNVVVGTLGEENERLKARVAELEASLRTPALMDSNGYLAEYRKAIAAFEVPQEPLQVYDSNSWRRVGLAGGRYKEVVWPVTQRDGHPDIVGANTLRALVAAFNAMPEALAEIKRLTTELAEHMWWERTAVELQRQRDELHEQLQAGPSSSFQTRVIVWIHACFGSEIASDHAERNHRFLEEALELVQAAGCSKSEAVQLVDYVYGRPAGVMSQEVGGVMVTLAALCGAFALDMQHCAEAEITRIWISMPEIRSKQGATPKYSALPGAATAADHHSV